MRHPPDEAICKLYSAVFELLFIVCGPAASYDRLSCKVDYGIDADEGAGGGLTQIVHRNDLNLSAEE